MPLEQFSSEIVAAAGADEGADYFHWAAPKKKGKRTAGKPSSKPQFERRIKTLLLLYIIQQAVDLLGCNAAVAAFFGSLTAGLLASLLMKRLGYPRISVTVPSIVIMVPGLYLYRAVYNMGVMSLDVSADWLVSALLIILMLPLGLICARIITDRSFRHCG